MDEINWQAIDKLKDEQPSQHDETCIQIERNKRHDSLDKNIMRLKEHIPEPTNEKK
jgi:hypothetical protein